MSSFKKYIDNSSLRINSIFDIDLPFLLKYKIKGVVFDFDGVLNTDSTVSVDDAVRVYLNDLSQNYPIALHSNAELPERKRKFQEDFPQIVWVDNPPKKPSPSALIQLSKKWNLPVESLLMIDDRLLTGGLSAYRARSQFAWVVTPKKNYFKRPVRELIFSLIRGLEVLCLRLGFIQY